MKIRIVGANQTVLSLNSVIEVFFSYETPVAAFVPGRGYLKTDTKWSVTTSKHITLYAGKTNGTIVPQSELDQLIA